MRSRQATKMTRLALLLVVAATAVLVHGAAAEFTFNAFMTPEEQQLMDWTLSEGARLRVTIGRNAEGVRGLFTTMDVKQGEILVDIPEHIILSVKNTGAAVRARLAYRAAQSKAAEGNRIGLRAGSFAPGGGQGDRTQL